MTSSKMFSVKNAKNGFQRKVWACQISSTTYNSTMKCSTWNVSKYVLQLNPQSLLTDCLGANPAENIMPSVCHKIDEHKGMAPISTMEQTSFVPLLKTFSPRFQLPSRNYFTREAPPKMCRCSSQCCCPACKCVWAGPANLVSHMEKLGHPLKPCIFNILGHIDI